MASGVTLVIMLLAVLGGSACAVSYRMPPETERFRAALDEPRALALVASAMEAKPRGAAGAYIAYLPVVNVPIRPHLVGRSIVFDVIGPRMSSTAEPPPGCRVPHGELVATQAEVDSRCTVQVRLDRLEQVRIAAVEGDPPGADWPIVKKAPGYVVLVQEEPNRCIGINISRRELNSLMAALSFLSPSAKLRVGAGF